MASTFTIPNGVTPYPVGAILPPCPAGGPHRPLVEAFADRAGDFVLGRCENDGCGILKWYPKVPTASNGQPAVARAESLDIGDLDGPPEPARRPGRPMTIKPQDITSTWWQSLLPGAREAYVRAHSEQLRPIFTESTSVLLGQRFGMQHEEVLAVRRWLGLRIQTPPAPAPSAPVPPAPAPKPTTTLIPRINYNEQTIREYVIANLPALRELVVTTGRGAMIDMTGIAVGSWARLNHLIANPEDGLAKDSTLKAKVAAGDPLPAPRWKPIETEEKGEPEMSSNNGQSNPPLAATTAGPTTPGTIASIAEKSTPAPRGPQVSIHVSPGTPAVDLGGDGAHLTIESAQAILEKTQAYIEAAVLVGKIEVDLLDAKTKLLIKERELTGLMRPPLALA